MMYHLGNILKAVKSVKYVTYCQTKNDTFFGVFFICSKPFTNIHGDTIVFFHY